MADECPKCPDGLPPWLATFADLMSLLMCFFVLLLSFAEVDAQRFKKLGFGEHFPPDKDLTNIAAFFFLRFQRYIEIFF